MRNWATASRLRFSSSLAAALDGAPLDHSRSKGFYYNPASDALVLINTKHKKGSRVVISYKRWRKQRELK